MSFILLLDGYYMSQIKIYGQFSYDRSSQRDLQFQTDIREIDLRRRVWYGEESEWNDRLGRAHRFILQRTTALMGWRFF
jgi:hypothetical protein